MKNRSNRPRIPFRERVYRFFYGRNGGDALGMTAMITALVINTVNLFLSSLILHAVSLAFLGYSFFRMLSRNVVKRRLENAKFCGFFRGIRNFFVLQKNKWRDRKTHVYQKCRHCKKVLRLPRVKGEHTVRCPVCASRFSMRVK